MVVSAWSRRRASSRPLSRIRCADSPILLDGVSEVFRGLILVRVASPYRLVTGGAMSVTSAWRCRPELTGIQRASGARAQALRASQPSRPRLTMSSVQDLDLVLEDDGAEAA